VTLLALAYLAFGCAALPALLYLWNSFLFRPPPNVALPSGLEDSTRPTRISALIPARNEEASIAACVGAVLASRGVAVEVIVLDDHSADCTAEIVREIGMKDSRVRVEPAPPLPDGWCGKQHACFVLARLARFPVLTFLDADVRLAPDALARMAAFLRQSRAGLVSGFPRQETGTLLERLVIPLINWLLVCYLPMVGMRHTRFAAFAVGCGQWFTTTRPAYDVVGGHAAVKGSLHDGLTLPRAYRRAGFHTDICDATDLAVCRMYRSAEQVWFGLAKNAREGMAATSQIGFWTVMLFCGQVLPFLLVLWWPWRLAQLAALQRERMWSAGWSSDATMFAETEVAVALLACFVALLCRVLTANRFRQSCLSALLHPLGVLVLLAIQWYAVCRAVVGRPVGWKGRPPPGS
jgi:hypothetical protein